MANSGSASDRACTASIQSAASTSISSILSVVPSPNPCGMINGLSRGVAPNPSAELTCQPCFVSTTPLLAPRSLSRPVSPWQRFGYGVEAAVVLIGACLGSADHRSAPPRPVLRSPPLASHVLDRLDSPRLVEHGAGVTGPALGAMPANCSSPSISFGRVRTAGLEKARILSVEMTPSIALQDEDGSVCLYGREQGRLGH